MRNILRAFQKGWCIILRFSPLFFVILPTWFREIRRHCGLREMKLLLQKPVGMGLAAAPIDSAIHTPAGPFSDRLGFFMPVCC